MRPMARLRAALVGAAVAMGGVSNAWALSAGCNFINSLGSFHIAPGGLGINAGIFDRGEVITLTNIVVINGGVSLTLTSPASGTIVQGTTISVTVLLIGSSTIVGTATGGPGSESIINISCAAGSATGNTGSDTSASISQNIANAQTAVLNGQQMLQSYNDGISKGVAGSFSPGANGTGTASTARPTVLTAQTRMEGLRREEESLAEALAELPAGNTKEDLQRQLNAKRHELMYARASAALAAPSSERAGRSPSPSSMPERAHPASIETERGTMMAQPDRPGQPATQTDGGLVGRAPRQAAPMPQFSANAREFCDTADGNNAACEMLGKKWNAWLEGHVIGAVDSLAASNALGFVGSTGVDYKFLPWLAVGMSVGAETFETRLGTPGVRSGTIGISAAPYIGIRLDDNIFASIFAGLTSINYNNSPAVAVTAQFNALRVFFGGALTGVWREGMWRFQPTLSGAYGSEAQNAYTDSTGNAVQAQTVSYGRISVGPEVGYTFRRDDRNWSVEPFVLAKANLDFASSNAVTLNGLAVVLRPGTLGSGSLGLGVDTRFEKGFFLRLQGSYDSIGVTGLDIWTGLVRGGMTF
jgi:hypothetical protein